MPNRSTHVLIRGIVFTYQEKAPFVPSGMSVLGAVEYDFQNDLLRCHECGQWFESISSHLPTHKMSVLEYKLTHGLRLKGDGLVNQAIRTKQADACKRMTMKYGSPVICNDAVFRQASTEALRAAIASRPKEQRLRHEKRNQNARCDAQMLFRIQMLAAELGHTPSARDLYAIGLTPSAISQRFGSLTAAMLLVGLVPNHTTKPHSLPPLPDGFPSKQELEDRLLGELAS